MTSHPPLNGVELHVHREERGRRDRVGDLLERYDGHPGGQLRLALLAYNRGPAKVQELLDAGRDPQNGYSTTVMKEYRRR